MTKTLDKRADQYFREHPVRILMPSDRKARCACLESLRDVGYMRYGSGAPLASTAGFQELADRGMVIGVGVRTGSSVGALLSYSSTVDRTEREYITFDRFCELHWKNVNPQPQEGAKTMSNVPQVKNPNTNLIQDIADQLRPYKKYILAAAVLLCIDHFFLKGEVRHRIIAIVRKVSDKIIKLLEAGADTILGDEKPNTPPTP